VGWAGAYLAVLEDSRCGVTTALFVVRACDEARALLDAAWAMRHEGYLDWDQGAIQRLADTPEHEDGVMMLSPEWLGPEGWAPDAHLIHACGQTGDTVLDRLAYLCVEGRRREALPLTIHRKGGEGNHARSLQTRSLFSGAFLPGRLWACPVATLKQPRRPRLRCAMCRHHYTTRSKLRSHRSPLRLASHSQGISWATCSCGMRPRRYVAL
jgi:hypothetical protein